MASKYPPGFYVYLHIRQSDGRVFYVGKGKNGRAWKFLDRSDFWENVRDKHGVSVEVLKSGLSECCAYTLEKIAIARLGAQGHPLVNLSFGGEGSKGHVSPAAKRVHCSNGMSFRSSLEAQEWCRSNGWPYAAATHIRKCCRGELSNSYGHSWGWSPLRQKPKPGNICKPVCCSNGMRFGSSNEASEWLAASGINARPADIRRAARGTNATCAGFSWWFDGGEPVSFVPHTEVIRQKSSRPVIRCDGTRFPSAKQAAVHMAQQRGCSACTSSIVRSAKHGHYRAYGHSWSYA